MTGAHADDPSVDRARPRSRWRLGTPAVIVVCGLLLVVSAQNSGGTDLRPGRYTDLASLVRAESEQYDALNDRVTALSEDIAQLTDAVPDRGVKKARRRAERFRDPAGLVPREGPGLVVTMSDAPEDVLATSDQPPNLLVVHQQDLQAVVNAMWVGGATAITIQGQRLISTTGIKCEGNAVQLQGLPYPQPYVIKAVGDPDSIGAALEEDPDVSGYRADAATADIAVGWDAEEAELVEAPAYEGLLDITYAEPLEPS